MTTSALKSKVIMVQTAQGLRFFSEFGKKNRVQTAWCLSGAKLFLIEDELLLIVRKLKSLNKVVSVHIVECYVSPLDISELES